MRNAWNLCLAKMFNDVLETELILTWGWILEA